MLVYPIKLVGFQVAIAVVLPRLGFLCIQVLGLKLGLRGGFGFAKPGMPADGRIQVQNQEWAGSK